MGNLPQITNLYVIAGLATIGGLIQGFDVSSLSAIIGTKQVRDIFHVLRSLTRSLQYKTFFHSPGSVKQGGITASMAGGSLLRCLFASWTGDRFGRRDSLFIACIIWLVGSTLMSAVQNTAMLIVSRIINGFALLASLRARGRLLFFVLVDTERVHVANISLVLSSLLSSVFRVFVVDSFPSNSG